MNNKIYIAGKITGDPDYRIKFKVAQSDLNLARISCTSSKPCSHQCPFYDRNYIFGCLIPQQFVVVNPATFGRDNKSYLVTMLICLHHIRKCSYVYFLHDWTDSRGARIEHRWAKFLRKRIIYEKRREVSTI